MFCRTCTLCGAISGYEGQHTVPLSILALLFGSFSEPVGLTSFTVCAYSSTHTQHADSRERSQLPRRASGRDAATPITYRYEDAKRSHGQQHLVAVY